MIILKVTQKQHFTHSIEDPFWDKRGQTDPTQPCQGS